MKKALRILLAILVLLVAAFCVFWFTRAADTNFEAARALVPHSAYSHFADVDGVRLHYQEKGNGQPLILIHGYTASTIVWKEVFEPLAANFRVLAVDMKGFGFSAKPDGDYTRRAQGELLVKLLDHLKIDRAILCGNSMGGEISLNAARYHPQRVRALILVDSQGVTVEEAGSSVAPGFTSWPVVGPIVTALALTSDSLVRDGLKKNYVDKSKVTEEMIAAYYRPLKTRGGQLAAFRARQQALQQSIEPEVGKIALPTLILWGAEDEIIPVAAGRKLNSLIAGSRLAVFDRCGHLPQSEMPDRFLNELTSFVATLNGSDTEVARATAGKP